MQRALKSHYRVLGLDRRCTLEQIRNAYRLLAKQHHPDVNHGSREAVARTQELNAAYETLGDPDRRRAYDRDLDAAPPPAKPGRGTTLQRNLTQDVNLRLEEFLRGTRREVRVHDPANPDGAEHFDLIVPPGTAPGTRFRLARTGFFAGGHVLVRVKAMAGFPFTVRGSDVRCDLRIQPARAQHGGVEMVQGLAGARLRVIIPRGAGRGELVRLTGEGLPKPRGGRGDLLVRLTYRVEVRVSRPTGR